MKHTLAILCCFLVTGSLVAGGGAKKQKPADDPASLDELAKVLRPLLADAMPKVLYEHEWNWGKQRATPHAVHWRGLRSKVVKEMRNDGTWRRINVTSERLDKTLDFKLFDLKKIDAEKQTFKCFIAFDAGIRFEQQVWESGLRLHGGTTTASVRILALLDCENTIRTEAGKSFIPDVVFRLRVTQAKVNYADLEFYKIAGIGGDAAPIIGEAVHDALRQWRPSLERNLLTKANTAIVKAADTKEVRLSLGSLFK